MLGFALGGVEDATLDGGWGGEEEGSVGVRTCGAEVAARHGHESELVKI